MAIYVVYPNDDQEKHLEAFLEAMNIDFVKDDNQPLPQHVLDGIAQEQADIKAGRFITYDEFKKKLRIENID